MNTYIFQGFEAEVAGKQGRLEVIYDDVDEVGIYAVKVKKPRGNRDGLKG